MNNLQYIRAELEKLKAEIDASPLGTSDMRTSYLELTFSSLELYYRQWVSIASARILMKNGISVTDDEKSVIEVFIGGVSDKITFYSIRNSSFRNLLIDSWSTFEFCLTYLCDSLFDEKTQKDLLEDDFKKIDKILSKYDIGEKDKAKITKGLAKEHLTHLSVNRKYEKIYSLFKNHYTGNWNEDKDFLEFYGKYRNSMHSNYIYHGKDKEYTFEATTYYFVNGKAIAHSKEPDIKEMFDMALRLKSTCKRLFDAIQYPGLLPFPESQVQQPI